ncbi:MAG: hypothetical protein ACPKQO_00730 [Nitrososphaeraceae archaeon]
MTIFFTGSKKIDNFLRGGIRTGIVTDIFGESSSGKSQFCFSFCANVLKKHPNYDIIFVDTTGTFRPERIMEILGDENDISILDNIKYIRPFTFYAQNKSLEQIQERKPKIVIIDSITSLISIEYATISRHLIFMKYLHKLALLAINHNIAIIATNTMRNNTNLISREKKIKQDTGNEFMESALILYSHFRLRFEKKNQLKKNLYKITCMQPFIKDEIYFNITKNGII